jgi:hypothetical protein
VKSMFIKILENNFLQARLSESFQISSFILLMSVMTSGVACSCWNVFHLFDVMNPNRLNGETLG